MRRLRYQVACSLDGYIAGPEGEFDWIIDEPAFDFEALYAQFDVIVMGRKTYEKVHSFSDFSGKQVIVASNSMRQEDYPDVEVVSNELETRVRELKNQDGRDIWLYGGGDLLSQLLNCNLVDTVEPAIIPILLGGGIPLLATNGVRRQLTLIGQHTYPSGMVLLEYEVQRDEK